MFNVVVLYGGVLENNIIKVIIVYFHNIFSLDYVSFIGKPTIQYHFGIIQIPDLCIKIRYLFIDQDQVFIYLSRSG